MKGMKMMEMSLKLVEKQRKNCRIYLICGPMVQKRCSRAPVRITPPIVLCVLSKTAREQVNGF
jgi:hypothetical protein